MIKRAQEHVDIAWSWACIIRGTDCRNIIKPLVAYTDDLSRESQGRYMVGSGMVEVALAYYGDRYSIVVMVHEMTHYLQYLERGGRPRTITERCRDEMQAFSADDTIAHYLGLDTHPDAFTWGSVASAYGCTSDLLER